METLDRERMEELHRQHSQEEQERASHRDMAQRLREQNRVDVDPEYSSDQDYEGELREQSHRWQGDDIPTPSIAHLMTGLHQEGGIQTGSRHLQDSPKL
jgi:hypothetical protein